MTEVKTIRLGGFPTVAVTRAQLAKMMVQDCRLARQAPRPGPPRVVFSSNGQGIALAAEESDFAETMTQATWIHADGMPVVVASRFTTAPLPERIATTDFFHDAAKAAADADLSFFMLGGTEGENQSVIEAIGEQYPALRVVGSHHGYFADDESERICAMVRESGADVLWVALGKPRQEFWSIANRENLTGVGWIKTCGGLYAFLTGRVKRAPRWAQRLGMEWLFRAFQEPRRLLKRYLVTNPVAIWKLVAATDRRPVNVPVSGSKVAE